MLKVGLTGNLCSGYEDVAAQFQKLGVPVFDADVVSKFMIHYDEIISKDIRIRFGQKSFEHGFLNDRVFDTTQKLDLLLDTVNKKLMQSWERFRIKHSREPYVIFKYALLFERGIDSSMNYTICSFRPKDDRVLLLKDLSGIPFVEAYSLIENGPDDYQKNKLSTYVIHNYDDAFVGLEKQAQEIDRKLKSKVEPQRFDSDVNSLLKNVFT